MIPAEIQESFICERRETEMNTKPREGDKDWGRYRHRDQSDPDLWYQPQKLRPRPSRGVRFPLPRFHLILVHSSPKYRWSQYPAVLVLPSVPGTLVGFGHGLFKAKGKGLPRNDYKGKKKKKKKKKKTKKKKKQKKKKQKKKKKKKKKTKKKKQKNKKQKNKKKKNKKTKKKTKKQKTKKQKNKKKQKKKKKKKGQGMMAWQPGNRTHALGILSLLTDSFAPLPPSAMRHFPLLRSYFPCHPSPRSSSQFLIPGLLLSSSCICPIHASASLLRDPDPT